MEELDWDKIKTVEDCVAVLKLLTGMRIAIGENSPRVQFSEGLFKAIPELKNLAKGNAL